MRNDGERQTIFLLSQFIAEDKILWSVLEAGILLIFLFLLIFWSVRRRKRQNRGEKLQAVSAHVTGDTAEMPPFQDIWLRQYGFRVAEDITCIHTGERIAAEEYGGTEWNG